MPVFTLELNDAAGSERIDEVACFVGEDASGSFGILAGHARMLTALVTGLARFRAADGGWTYLALPGGVLYFRDQRLTISTRRYLLDRDYRRISAALQRHLLAEEDQLRDMKRTLHRMEQEVFRRLWEIGRGATP